MSINGYIYNKTTIDGSINSILGYYSTKDNIDSSLNLYYTKTAIDASINGNIYNKTAVDASFVLKSSFDNSMNTNYYSKTTIDGSINSILGFYTTTVNMNNRFDSTDLSINNMRSDIQSIAITGSARDPSINDLYLYNTIQDTSINSLPTKEVIDNSLGFYYTKTVIDASINGNIYNKTTIDSSINSILRFYSTKDIIDNSLGFYYTKTAIDASINGNIYNKTTIDGSINKILGFYSTKDIIDGSLGLYYTKTAIDASINGNIYNKTTIDGSINSILGFYYTKDIIDGSLGLYYTKTAIDASINGNIYNKTTIDGSINKILGFYSTKDVIDGSLGLYYTKTVIDASINDNIYNKTTIDSSINSILGFYTTTTNMNNRFDSTDLSINALRTDIESISNTGSTRDPSINELYSYNTIQDTSINSLPTKDIIDGSLGLYYTKTAIDASINGNIYNKTTIDGSINSILGFYYTKTAIDASINGNIYNKTTIDGSINSILGFYYTKTTIDASINGNIYNKTTIDGSINSILGLYYTKTTIDASINGNIYNKTTIDGSINSVLLKYASLQTDVSFAGNIQMGSTTSTRFIGINKPPSTAYALDVNGTINATSILLNGAAIGGSIPGYSANTFSFDTSFNGNVQIGSATSTRSLGINCAPNPAYSLDVSGDVRITETGPGTLASATTGSLVLHHTTASGRSSITFTSPNAGGDYGYIQYYDNNNPSNAVTETSGGLMVIGVENKDGSGNTSDRISLYADAGTGNVGVNTLSPEYQLDVSGTLRYSAVSENLVSITATGTITLVYGTGNATLNGMVRYIQSFSGNQTLDITNIPLIMNRSYVFTFIYMGAATTSYINAVRLAFAGVVTPLAITTNLKGTVTAPTSTNFFIQQFYVFIIDPTITNNFVFQTLTS
jgi:hypothetical protein